MPHTPDISSSQRQYLVGLLLVLCASILWSLNGALIKLAHDAGPPAVTIAFYRSFFAGLSLMPLAWGRFHTLRRKRLPGQFADPLETHSVSARRGSVSSFVKRITTLRPAAWSCVIFFTLMTVCFVLANTLTEAANVIVLQYTSTFWIFGLSPMLLREHPQKSDVGLLLLAMAGVAVIFAGDASADLVGLVTALASGFFYALLTLMIRQMRDSDSAAVTVLNNLGSALLLLPVVFLFGDFWVSGRAWVLLVIMGVVQFGIPYYLYSLGLARVVAYQAALITLAEVILNPVWTFLAMAEVPPLTTIVGGSVILAALILFLLAAKRRTQSARAASR